MKHSRKVVTWQSPNGSIINICRICERDLLSKGDWPKDHTGQEYCSCSCGEHTGVCYFSNDGKNS